MKLKFVLLGLVLFLTGANPVRAANEFESRYRVDYLFDAFGRSHVEQHIALTNLVSDIYASKYQLLIEGDPPSDMAGTDSKGALKISSVAQDGGTLITVEFNDQVVGIGNTLNFVLTYSGLPAQHTGQVWEMHLPGIAQPQTMTDYKLNLKVDPSLGKMAFVSPPPESQSDHTYHFSKNQIGKTGIVAAFGNFQTFGFKLTYHLDNPSDRSVYTEIALPPDTNFQRVYYDSLQPSPVNVRVDDDGNWLARYDLKPHVTETITAAGQAHVLAESTPVVPADNPNNYLSSTKYWPTQHPQIVSLAAQLKTPEAIYNYVVDTLQYDYSKIGTKHTRLGAIGALATPSESVCTEFTDLFIALSRAAGIPAREINGYAYSPDSGSHPLSLGSDVLHAWPQYYDTRTKSWIDVDPTWENTTGGIDYFHKWDFDHFAFVIHGKSDTEPLAAGFYKNQPNTKDLTIDLADYKNYSPLPPQIIWITPPQIFPIKPQTSKLQIYNSSGQAIYRTNLAWSSTGFELKGEQNASITTLPPFARQDYSVVFQPPWGFNLHPQILTVRANQTDLTYNIPSRSYLLWQISVALVFATIFITVAVLAGRAWGLHLQRQNKVDPVRGKGQKP